MDIVIENTPIEFNLACRMLKLKYVECPFDELQDFWNDIVPLTFMEIAKLNNLELRRIGMLCLGLTRMVEQVQPKLINKKTIKKVTSWVDESGELVEHKFNDTYELYEVNGSYFNEGLTDWRKMESAYYVKCKDTSTDREYLIWVDVNSIWSVKRDNEKDLEWQFNVKKINAIDCVAWTIQTNIKKGGIDKILRQGDCILIKPNTKHEIGGIRHLSAKEYLTLLVAES
jgi:hypothetical protein